MIGEFCISDFPISGFADPTPASTLNPTATVWIAARYDNPSIQSLYFTPAIQASSEVAS